MLGLALEGAIARRLRRRAPGMRRLDEATAAALEDRAEIPISAAWTFCLLVSACLAVADFERASAWCDRIARLRAALQQPLHARVLPRRVRRRRRVARPLDAGRRASCPPPWPTSSARAPRGRPARWPGSPSCAAARAATPRPASWSIGPAPRARRCCAGARLELDRWRPQDAADLAERVLRQVRGDRRLDRDARRSTCSRTPARAPATSIVPPPRSPSSAQAAERVGTAPARAGADRADGVLSAARGDHERARTLLEDAARRLRARRSAVRGRARRASSWPAAWRRWGATTPPSARRPPPARALKALSADGRRPARGR